MSLNIVLTIVIPVVVVIAITITVGRTKSTRSGEFDSESLAFVGGVFNAVFIVILAFYVVFAWQAGDDIDSNSTAEADALTNIYYQADVAPQAQGAAIHSLARRYATEVVDREWSALAHNDTDPTASTLIGELRGRITALPTSPESVKEARQQALQDLQQVHDYHLKRVNNATSNSADNDPFTKTLLIATIAGSILMIVFPLLIGVTARGRHIVVMALMTTVLGVIVFLAVELTNPLEGLFAHSPQAFQNALQQFSAQP